MLAAPVIPTPFTPNAGIVSPYYLGYTDASRAGTYILRSVLERLPKMRYGAGSDAHALWMLGMNDFIDDQSIPPRRMRSCPPWRQI